METKNCIFLKSKLGNLKSVIAEQEKRCMELEKTSADNDSKKKKALTDAKNTEDKLNKQENLVMQKKAIAPTKRLFNRSIHQFFLIFIYR